MSIIYEAIEEIAKGTQVGEDTFTNQCIYLYEDYFQLGKYSVLVIYSQPHQLEEILELVRTIYYKSTF